MNNDFIQIKGLEGELKISFKKSDSGFTVSTKELVIQKPHVNYYIKLEDIISIVPFDFTHFRPLRVSARQASGSELCFFEDSLQKYAVYVKTVVMHNRSGFSRLGPTKFVLPIYSELLQAIGEYSGMAKFD